MKKYQPYCDFPAHGKNMAALSKMLWMLDGNVFDHLELTPIIVFEAFTIESYLNTVGAAHTEIWDELERLPWKKKISVLHKLAGKAEDWSKEPLQFANEVFQIRDRLAHGKPERVEGKMYPTKEEAEKVFGTLEIEPEWYKKITKQWVIDSRGRFEDLMRYLGGLYDFKHVGHSIGASGGIIEHDIT
jgi:hypothetical protein